MPIQQESHEKLLRFAHRISPIDLDHPSVHIYSSNELGWAEISWQQRPYDRVSLITLYFTDSNVADVQGVSQWKKRPRIVLSQFVVGKDKDSGERNPFDAVRVILTILATITKLSVAHGPLTHIVRSNELSKPIFELLVNLGIYYLSDEVGNHVDLPKEWKGEYILYGCKYPVEGMPDLSEFAPNELVAALSSVYLDGVKFNKLS
jgi:hypothetical protein